LRQEEPFGRPRWVHVIGASKRGQPAQLRPRSLVVSRRKGDGKPEVSRSAFFLGALRVFAVAPAELRAAAGALANVAALAVEPDVMDDEFQNHLGTRSGAHLQRHAAPKS
jgi:hypothetical protein